MNDDFNTPMLIAVLYDAVKVVNSAASGHMPITEEGISALRALFDQFAHDILGLVPETQDGAGAEDRSDHLMEVLCAVRAEAKANKDWATADLIRDRLGALGVQIKDSKDGTTWTFD
jgi:cysteinyl-tRNA synthetase